MGKRRERKLNSRFVAYCAAHGRDPDAMLAHDRKRWKGGCMAGFILWMNDRWAEWRRLNGRGDETPRTARPLSKEDHESFDAWLATGTHPQV